MLTTEKNRQGGVRSLAVIVMVAMTAETLWGQSATRDLTGFSGPGATFTALIAIDTPPATNVVGVEDAPPTGWSVSAISDGGSWDAATGKVKWGPFIAPSIPTLVTYDVTPPPDIGGQHCFSGTVSFDGPEQSIGGDACVGEAIPTISGAGLTLLGLLVLAAGCAIASRQRLSVPR